MSIKSNHEARALWIAEAGNYSFDKLLYNYNRLYSNSSSLEKRKRRSDKCYLQVLQKGDWGSRNDNLERERMSSSFAESPYELRSSASYYLWPRSKIPL